MSDEKAPETKQLKVVGHADLSAFQKKERPAQHPQQNVLTDSEEKLARLPKQVWDELRKQGLFIPKGSFSNQFFAKHRFRPEALRGAPRQQLKQTLLVCLDELLEHGIDQVTLLNFADDAMTVADTEMFRDLALQVKPSEDSEPIAGQ